MNVLSSTVLHRVLLARLWQHLSWHQKREFGLLVCLLLVSALAEVVSLGAVLPFLGILTAPDKIFNYPGVSEVALAWGVRSSEELVLPLTLVFVSAALLSGIIRIFVLWFTTRLAFSTGASLSYEVYRRSLYQPYQTHLARNSSAMISGITNNVNGVVFGVLFPILMLMSSVVLLVSIMIALLVIDPAVASAAVFGFGATYAFVTYISRKRLRQNSRRIACEQTRVVKAIQEGLGGIRDVLLDGTQPLYSKIYRQADYPLRQAQGNNVFLSGSPRPAMEALGMVLIAALAYALSKEAAGMSSALPILGALALGAQRLLPVLQQSYSAWTSIASNHAALANTIELLDQVAPPERYLAESRPLPFQSDIRFDTVRFRYDGGGPWVLDGLSLTISKGSRVGFVGRTGSGKSTMLDLLMGLLMPTDGAILVDDEPVIGDRLRSWQRSIAHVPQTTYLADSTLAENIAFGVSRASIDLDRVKLAARRAHIADFIESKPEGYNAHVGERGIRLSGGQRQRIGIARALYKQASVLVFDEATSALDTETEQSVMEAIEGLNRNLTILTVAHRLTTVRHCDIIVELDQGRIVAQGTYDQLIECSPSFRRLAVAMHQ